VLTVVAAGCGGASGDPRAVLHDSECKIPFLEEQREILDIRCYTLEVPEVRSDEESESIYLPVARLRLKGERSDRSPLMYLSGGPGGSVVNQVPVLTGGRLEGVGHGALLFE
jgi:hypothetical protein